MADVLSPIEVQGVKEMATGPVTVGAPMTAEKRMMQEFSNNVQEQRAEEALELVCTGLPPNWKQNAKEHVFSRRDASGDPVAASFEEQAAYDAIEKHTEAYEQFLLNGYDGTTHATKNILKNQVKQVIRQNPTLFDLYKDPGTGDIPEAVLEHILRNDAKLRAQLAQNLESMYAEPALEAIRKLDLEVAEARADYDTAQQEVAALKAKKDKIEGDPSDARGGGENTKKIRTFNTDTNYSGGRSKLQVLEELTIDADVKQYERLQKDLSYLQEQLRTGRLSQTERTDYAKRVQDLRTKMDAIETDNAKMAKIREKENLQTEQQQLLDERKEIEAEIPEIDRQLAEKEPQLEIRKQIKQQKERQRKEYTAKMKDTVTNALRDGSRDHIKQRFKETKEGYKGHKKEVQDKEKAEEEARLEEEVAQAERDIQRILRERYVEEYTPWYAYRGGITKVRVSKKAAAQDKTVLLSPGQGHEAILTQILDQQYPVTSGNQAQMNANQEIRDRLTRNKEFMDQTRDRIYGEVLSACTDAGVPVIPGEVRVIARSTYGRKAIKSWASRNEKVKGMLREASQAGVISDDVIDSFADKHPGWAKLLLLPAAVSLVGMLFILPKLRREGI